MRLRQEGQRFKVSWATRWNQDSKTNVQSYGFSPSVQHSLIIPINKVDCQSVISEVPSPCKRLEINDLWLWVLSPSWQELRHCKETLVSQWTPRIGIFPRNLIWGRSEVSGEQLSPSILFTTFQTTWKGLSMMIGQGTITQPTLAFCLNLNLRSALPTRQTGGRSHRSSLSLFEKPSHQIDLHFLFTITGLFNWLREAWWPKLAYKGYQN